MSMYLSDEYMPVCRVLNSYVSNKSVVHTCLVQFVNYLNSYKKNLIVVQKTGQKLFFTVKANQLQDTENHKRQLPAHNHCSNSCHHHLGNHRLVLPQGNHRCLRMSHITNNQNMLYGFV